MAHTYTNGYDYNGNDFAYLGEVTPKEFSEIRLGFPNIVGIDTITDCDTDETLIVLGISKSFSDEIIGLHQLIVSVFGNEDATSDCFEALCDNGLI